MKNYTGELKDGKRHGQGTLTMPTGDKLYDLPYKYVGGWKNDLKHGRGNIIFANGKKYIGQLWDQGTLIFAGFDIGTDVDRYSEEWLEKYG